MMAASAARDPGGNTVDRRNAALRVLDYFQRRKGEIQADLASFLATAGKDLGAVSPLGSDACELLGRFTSTGKMIRGALVCYTASRGASPPPAAIRVGTAMELFQSALLIHDDIMDRDTQRRGQPSVHQHYADWARGRGLAEAAHLGESLGICVADIAFFLAFQALSEVDAPAQVRADITRLFARELSLVGVAQMMDMSTAASSADPATDDVLRLYLYKTGRYTFSLPLRAGALLDAPTRSSPEGLDRLGEILGMLFQIKDDEIGLWGDPADTGKPVGSDIREGKKTLYHAYLVRGCPPEILDRVRSSWGRADLAEGDIRYLLDAMERHGARAEVDRLGRDLAGKAERIAAGEPFLSDLVAWSLERTR